MSSPNRTTSELIAAAQADGWHEDPLGRDFIAALTQRERMAAKPRQIIWALAGGLVVSLTLLGLLYAQNTRLAEVAAAGTKAGAQAELNADKRVAAAESMAAVERVRVEEAAKHYDELGKAMERERATTVEKFTAQLATLSKENDALRKQVSDLNASLTSANRTVKP